jgi:hypothetical protein
MPFDHSSKYQAADAAVGVNRELGRAYVEPGTENSELRIIDPRRVILLEAVARTLLPGSCLRRQHARGGPGVTPCRARSA